MDIPRTQTREALWIGPLLVAFLLVSGCAGFEPFEPRNDRVEGPKQGLFSGEAGEFVIYRRGGTEKQKTNSWPESKQQPDKSADGYQ